MQEDFLYAQRNADDLDNVHCSVDSDSSWALEHDEQSEDDQSVSPGLDETTVNLGVRTMLTMISSLSNGEVDRDFYDELQNSLYNKQRHIVNGIFTAKKGKKSKGKKGSSKSNQNGSTPPPQRSPTPPKKVKFVIPQPPRPAPSALSAFQRTTEMSSTLGSHPFDFKYCVDVERVPMLPSNSNRIATNGFLDGYTPKMKLSEKARRKMFSEKSYEEQKMLLEMYLDEMEQPVLPEILPHIRGKKLICCESAWNHLMEIVNLSAGQEEWRRCSELQKRITIVPDQMSERTKRLQCKSVSKINLV